MQFEAVFQIELFVHKDKKSRHYGGFLHASAAEFERSAAEIDGMRWTEISGPKLLRVVRAKRRDNVIEEKRRNARGKLTGSSK